jgi:hypothetical protein
MIECQRVAFDGSEAKLLTPYHRSFSNGRLHCTASQQQLESCRGNRYQRSMVRAALGRRVTSVITGRLDHATFAGAPLAFPLQGPV